nr:hypothetical protein [Tanacetum cinerariifolium]
MFDINDLHSEEVFVEKEVADKEVNDEVQEVVKEVVVDITTAKLIVDAAQVSAAGSSKRAGEELTQESAKKQKVNDDKEIAKIKQLMKIIPNEEVVAIDVIPLGVMSPKIVD